ncbi:hypothetical protein [Ideonella sp. A 288]|uniref:hypothetical protein n=1 Tax=Ideonella sp. A 288 TaxID=1962181 RepID=UPI000B4BD7AF|nr:hypothetical protein [Ideonella sp. A 288]
MSILRQGIGLAVLTLAATAASAQFIKGNEAVRLMPDGSRRFYTPPMPSTGPASQFRPCAADDGCHAGAWHMVETSDGLRECTEPFARPSTCRSSSYGARRLARLWVARKGSTWFWCQYPDLGSKCVDMHARPPSNLPYDAVQ